MVAVRRAGEGLHDLVHARVPDYIQERYGAVHVGPVGGRRALQLPEHGTQRRLVEHDVHFPTGHAAGVRFHYILLHEPEPSFRGDWCLHWVLDVPPVPARGVVQPEHLLIQAE